MSITHRLHFQINELCSKVLHVYKPRPNNNCDARGVEGLLCPHGGKHWRNYLNVTMPPRIEALLNSLFGKNCYSSYSGRFIAYWRTEIGRFRYFGYWRTNCRVDANKYRKNEKTHLLCEHPFRWILWLSVR